MRGGADQDGFEAWAEAKQTPLSGDASSRRYVRLSNRDGHTAIQMHAPVATEDDRQSLRQFLRMAEMLSEHGFSAPCILARDSDAGRVILEDFGDTRIAQLVERGAEEATDAYHLAGHVTQTVETLAMPDWIPQRDVKAQIEMVDLPLSFLPGFVMASPLREALHAALAAHCAGPLALSLRDYHGDNLMHLPEREGQRALGLLDFQDAVGLPAGYDLASLVDDPRRIVPLGLRNGLLERYAEAKGTTLRDTERRINILSLLRNIRILGIFYRLETHLGKHGYLGFLPRTRDLISRAIEDPDLAKLRAPVAALLDATKGWAE